MNQPTMAEFKANRAAYNKGHRPFATVDRETRLAELARDRETAVSMRDDYKSFQENASSDSRREAYSMMAAKHQSKIDSIDLESTMLKNNVKSAEDLQALASRASVGDAVNKLSDVVATVAETDEERLERIQREIRQFEESGDEPSV